MIIREAIRRANSSFTYRAYRGWPWRWAFAEWFRRLGFELRHNYRRKAPSGVPVAGKEQA